MVNKIFSKLKEFFIEEWKFLIILFITFIICTYPVDYYIITGGGIISATDRVEVVGAKKKKGSFSLTYVAELRGTIGTYLLSYIIPSFEKESIEEYTYNDKEDTNDIDYRNTLLLNNANNSAIYVAYTTAGKKIEEVNNGLYIYYIDKKAETDLKIGDKVLEIDGNKLETFDEVKEYISSCETGKKITITTSYKDKKKKRTAKVYEEEGKKYIGVAFISDISYKTTPKVKINFKDSEGGPSGGLMMTLEIYSQLVNKDITKGNKIAGTGTIDTDGNVGEIDGIKYKLRGAVKNKCTIFIAPTGRNYKEAVKEKEKHNYSIKIIEAKTFEQVLEELKKI